MIKFAALFLLVSCGSPKAPESSHAISADTYSQPYSTAEKDLLRQKVEEISERQKNTEAKVEKILEHIEGLEGKTSVVVNLNTSKRQDLQKSWYDIEQQKKAALDTLDGEVEPGDTSSGIVTPLE